MKTILGIDIGYGFTKSYYLQNNVISGEAYCFDVFPTAVSKFIPKITFSDTHSIVKVNDERFLTGETALREGAGLMNTRQSDFVGSSAYCAILSLALARTVSDPDILILGLPPGQYNNEYAELITKKIQSSKISLTDGKQISVPETIRFIPQGAGIYFSHIRHSGDTFNKRVAVLDVGFYTLDTLFFVNGKYVENSAQSHQLGVSRVYDQIRKEFHNEFRVPLKNHKSIDLILTTGKVTIMGETYKFDARHIIDSYNAQVSSNLANYIENLPDEVDLLVGGGGGVRFLDSNAFKYKFSITEHPQFANARGYFEFGKHLMARL